MFAINVIAISAAAINFLAAASCDQNALCGVNGYCKIWQTPPTCQGSGAPCSCSVTTTASPTSTGGGTTTAPSGGCASSSVKVFLWTEWPTLGTDPSAWASFYSGLQSFVQGNCAGLQVTKLVLRVLTPAFPVSSSTKIWANPASSPMFSSLISGLSNVELSFYPYLGDSDSVAAWQAISPINDAMDGVLTLMTQWNSFLASQGSSSKFSGITLDLEEGITVTAASVSTLKAKFGSFEVGVSIGFDETGKLNTMASFVDKFYLQFYDFYQPTAFVDSTAQSPFLLNQNDPSSMLSNIMNVQLTSAEMSEYSSQASKVYAMWSDQSLGTACQYPLTSTCGANNEFGTWAPAAFNSFMQSVENSIQVSAHGIFQYSFIPLSWK